MKYAMKLFKVSDKDGVESEVPQYVMKDGKLFRTAFHPRGWSDTPDYDMGNDGRFYRTGSHELGQGELADYEFGKDMKIYRTQDHPDGALDLPEYMIKE